MKNYVKWAVIIGAAILAINIVIAIIKLLAQLAGAMFEMFKSIGGAFLLLAILLVAGRAYVNRRTSQKIRRARVLNERQSAPAEAELLESRAAVFLELQQVEKESTPKLADPIPQQVEFLVFVQRFSEADILALVDQRYNELSQSYEQIGFGEVGANEFVASLLLGAYIPQLEDKIVDGYQRIFAKEWGPLQFSHYMDDLVYTTTISYANWRAACRYLEDEHKWIKQYTCAKRAYKLSP